MPPKQPLETNPVIKQRIPYSSPLFVAFEAGIEHLFVAIVIGIELWILYYLYSLGKNECKCALNWRRTYIMVMFCVHLALVVARFALLDASPLPGPVMILVTGAYIAAWIFALQYVADLEKNKCACSEDPAREALVIISWFRLGLLMFLLLAIIVALGSVFYFSTR